MGTDKRMEADSQGEHGWLIFQRKIIISMGPQVVRWAIGKKLKDAIIMENKGSGPMRN